MSNPVPFHYGTAEVRVVQVDGEHWWVAADVARVLGYTATAAMTRSLDDDEKGVRILHTPGGEQEMTVISESGLYSTILRSRVERAADFRRWVTREVLPEIRRTGGYSPTPALSEDEIVHQALQITARKVKELEAQVVQLAPKASAYERFLDGDGSYSVGAAAKIVGRSQNKLYSDLRAAGILISKGHMRNTPYQRYMHHFEVKGYDYERTDGTFGTSYTTRVRPSGLLFIARKLGLEGLLPIDDLAKAVS